MAAPLGMSAYLHVFMVFIFSPQHSKLSSHKTFESPQKGKEDEGKGRAIICYHEPSLINQEMKEGKKKGRAHCEDHHDEKTLLGTR